jgi:methionyl-tRNA formyltransferase
MGTPEFATESLKALISAGANIVGVITAPDKPSGRGQKLKESPVKSFALEHGLTILQPEKLKDPTFLQQLKDLKADLQVVVAFRMLPEAVWNMPPMGTINLHGSLLPNYRGAAPINWAVINGEKKTGVTTFFIKHEIDTGNLIFQEEVAIQPEDTAGTLHDKLMEIGARLMVNTVKAIGAGKVESHPQPIQTSKPAPKIFKVDCRINWKEPQDKVNNLIRGLSPYPSAWTELSSPGEKPVSLKIFRAKPCDTHHLQPGEIKSDGKKELWAGTGTGDLLITELQLAGKKRMSTEDFLKGFRFHDKAAFL